MMMTFENALKQQKDLGYSHERKWKARHVNCRFAEDEIDNMRLMIAETNPYLLTVTMAVSMLHILFDWLAFKSDIAFWQQNVSLVGISIWSMVSSLISQFIVFLYLIEQETTLLILVPSGISIVIQIWKIWRATRPKFSLSWHTLVKVELSRTDFSSESNDIDKTAMTYMGFTLYPLMLGYSVYSLLCKGSSLVVVGWRCIASSLYLNYRLKSVAHLPWRFLIYRCESHPDDFFSCIGSALNTFIDDLFAFVIHMPTMHRIRYVF
ncbi:hypothetical protein DYB32_005251 [Aphanomyces invadans]|uniref:Uncharacterized protein n=1 Tax=Aphanomyces invadans TaxID=157072 RepID=A0A418AZB2_9STRA|nr:hypothetical protein DYB32_005251 [Aphanomyces invadans]